MTCGLSCVHIYQFSHFHCFQNFNKCVLLELSEKILFIKKKVFEEVWFPKNNAPDSARPKIKRKSGFKFQHWASHASGFVITKVTEVLALARSQAVPTPLAWPLTRRKEQDHCGWGVQLPALPTLAGGPMDPGDFTGWASAAEHC